MRDGGIRRGKSFLWTKGESNGDILVILHPLDLDWHRIIRGQEMTDDKERPD